MKVLLTLLLFINFAFALNLQKPSTYEDSIDISNWYMSEKLDGIRAYWDGKELFTKNRNKIFAPSWFTKDFPPFPLDGELWTKRGDFENIQSIVLSQQESEYWKNITYNIFEIPNVNGNFKTRLEFLENYLKKNPNRYIKIIPQIVCKDKNHLNKFLKELLKNYPEMDSFYITVGMEERIKRFHERAKSGNEVTGSDKLIMDVDKFEKREKIYKKIVLEIFPNTKIIDTTNINQEETIELIINDKNFMKDM